MGVSSHCSEPCFQLANTERLSQVIVGAGIEQPDLGYHVAISGQYQYRRGNATLAPFLANGQAGNIRQIKV